jgi:hypothetical protein
MPPPPAPTPGYADRVLVVLCLTLIVVGIAMSFW